MRRALLSIVAGLAMMAAACSLLPDRVFLEAHQSPIMDTAWQDVVGGEDHLIGFGVEWDLKPARVVIAGQREAHPWDVGSMLGIYDGKDGPVSPTPLVVADQAVKRRTEEMRDSIEIMAASIQLLAADIASLRASSDAIGQEWDAVNKTLLGGGGLSGLILLIIGARGAIGRRKQDNLKKEQI